MVDPALAGADDKVCGIYGIFNTANRKVYVGQSVDVYRRRGDHFRGLRSGGHYNPHLQRAFEKYGEPFFEFRVIEECSEEVLDRREIAWIDHYKSFDAANGYNLETGGHSGKRLSDETREKISKARVGSKLSPETIAKRTTSRAYWKPSPEHLAKLIAANRTREYSKESIARGAAKRRGRKATKETIEKLRLSHLGKPLTREHAEKIGDAHRGKKRSEEARARMSAAQQRPEVREKQRVAQKARRERERLERERGPYDK